ETSIGLSLNTEELSKSIMSRPLIRLKNEFLNVSDHTDFAYPPQPFLLDSSTAKPKLLPTLPP
ncbi:hypothetical protein OFC62_28305, partial [Escherichia coli]|nr:hypothetical protein [Escherichia coli]